MAGKDKAPWKLTGSQKAIWEAIKTHNQLGISTKRKLNLVSILARRFTLFPLVVRYRDQYALYDRTEWFRRGEECLDGQLQAYYLASDCAEAIGSTHGNWIYWALAANCYEKDSKRFAPKQRIQRDLFSALVEAGRLGPRYQEFRLMSLEVLALICLAKEMWHREDKIKEAREVFEMQLRITGASIQYRGPEKPEDETAADIIERGAQKGGEEEGSILPPPPKGMPKSAQDLYGYNPSAYQKPEEAAIPQTDEERMALTISDLQNQISLLVAQKEAKEAELKRRRAERKERELTAAALKGQIVGGKLVSGEPEWEVVRIQYPDGSVVVYTRAGKESKRDTTTGVLVTGPKQSGPGLDDIIDLVDSGA